MEMTKNRIDAMRTIQDIGTEINFHATSSMEMTIIDFAVNNVKTSIIANENVENGAIDDLNKILSSIKGIIEKR